MKNINDIWIGHLDSSISSLIMNLSNLISQFSFTLITSIDSTKNLHKLNTVNKIVNDLSICSFFNEGLLISGNKIQNIMKQYNLLNGFDELWFFHSKPLINYSSELWITGPRDITIELPRSLPKWMKNSGCILGLGDGIGLNYITTNQDIAIELDESIKK